MEKLSKFEWKVEYQILVYVERLLVNVVTCKEANVMLNVKATKSLPAQFNIVSLLKHQTSILKAVAWPLFKCFST
jgi:hypothetical protein